MRREPDTDLLEVGVEPDQIANSPVTSRRFSRGIATTGVGLAILVGLQLIPGGEARSPASGVADSAPTTPSSARALVVDSEFQWVPVQGLERFESVTKPLPTDLGYLAVANPWGINGAASVMVSTDGSHWNRWGTIHGIGGETQIFGIQQTAEGYRAVGLYTESLPLNEFAVIPRIAAVWTSQDAIKWEMRTLPSADGVSHIPTEIVVGQEPVLIEVGDDPYRTQAEIAIGQLPADGHVEYFGSVDQALAMVRTTTTPTVTIRQTGMVGDSFASRVDSVTHALLISQDLKVWMSQVFVFDEIRFNGGVGGAFFVRASSTAEPDRSSYWLVKP